MTDMSYGQHMKWCKDRALAFLDAGDCQGAFASFASDVMKHPETAAQRMVKMLLATEGSRCATNADTAGMRRLIEGFASD